MKIEPGTKTESGTVKAVLCEAIVLHDGWDMDNTAWAVKFEDGTHAILMTSHGDLYAAHRSELEEKLRETEQSAEAIRALLALTA